MRTPATLHPRLVAHFSTPGALHGALSPAGRDHELVVVGPSDPAIPIGAIVRVSVEVKGHAPVEVEAFATWRRPVARGGMPAALGLRLDGRAAERVLGLRPPDRLADDVRDVLEWRSKKR